MSCTFPTPTARRVALSFTSIYQLLPLLLFTASGALSHNANRPGSAAAAIEFSTNPCPVVLGCSCIEHDTTIVECHRIGPETIPQLREQYPSLYTLHITEWKENLLDLDAFSNFTTLKKLLVVESEVEAISLSTRFATLSHLTLDHNMFAEWEQFCNITWNLPSLFELSLNSNRFSHIAQCVADLPVNTLRLCNNKITVINATVSESIRDLDLSFNMLRSTSGIHGRLRRLNMSHNPLVEGEFPVFTDLERLDLSAVKFTVAPRLEAAKLNELVMDLSDVEMVDFRNWNVPHLKLLHMGSSSNLKFVSGEIPNDTEELVMTKTKLAAFPQSFFSRSALLSLKVNGTNFDCDPCVMQWSIPVASLMLDQIRCPPVAPLRNCTLGISAHDPNLVRAEVGQSAILPCTAYGTPEPTVECSSNLDVRFLRPNFYRQLLLWGELFCLLAICRSEEHILPIKNLCRVYWLMLISVEYQQLNKEELWLYRPATLLGVFDPRSGVSSNSSMECCEVLGGGALLLRDVNRSMVERYVCVVRQNPIFLNRTIHFRLDYSNWYSLDLFSSVFWGGIATAVLACSFSFLLNITWILTRKSILWWINRAERLSRVRKMVEAMEKYRARQMEGLQAKYAKRMQLVRENYHAQVEQLRLSYSSQAEKFRDYRAAQMEQMSSHLENIRENYNQQMQRVREYGSRRAEQLWESYERQVNRVKAFSLQHRLKMMRQYKVKQGYLNRLLESFQDSTTNPEVMRQHEQEVRAALEMPVPPVSPTEPHPLPLSRASSFYSLPEYIIDDDGVLRPSPIIGRFTTNTLRAGNDENRHSIGATVFDGATANGVVLSEKPDAPGSSGS